jgi:hypothetical protein
MRRGWKRAKKLSTAPVPYPTAVFQGAEAEPDREELRGHQQNAWRMQIWTAFVALLLLKWRHHLPKVSLHGNNGR